MLRRGLGAGLLCAVMAAGGCSTTQPTAAARYAGFVSLGSSLQAFGPCGQAEQWWIADRPQDLTDRYDAVATSAYHPVYVVLEGNVDAARHGPDGTFNRELRVTRLVEVDAVRESC